MDRKDVEQCSLDALALVLGIDKDEKDCKSASNRESKGEEVFFLETLEEVKDLKLKESKGEEVFFLETSEEEVKDLKFKTEFGGNPET